MIYSKRIKDLREKSNLKLRDIYKILNFELDSYGQFECEKTILPIKHLNKLANYFNVSIDYLFSFTDVKNYSLINKEIDTKISGLRLKEFRKENNLTQLKLSQILKSDNSTISKYEKGINVIATPFLYDICKKYNISADYLLGKIENPKYLSK